MINRFNNASSGTPQLILSIFFLCLNAPVLHADQSQTLQQMQTLEEDFRNISRDFYQNASRRAGAELLKTDDIELLSQRVNKLQSERQSISAIQLLYINQGTLLSHIDDHHIFEFINLLLEHNEWHLASKLYEALDYEGDRTLLAIARFEFAKYHARRHEWQQVHELLDGVMSELSAENAAYAYLLNGSALQHLRQHRESVNSYKKIPPGSRYYSYARLNTAIANIRQGWWTDAQITIENYLEQSGKDNRDEMTNRLYLVLGYALLQQEFYRDARNAFRHIALDSRYTNRALLGIGLTATSQGDFVGGINALTILKQKQTQDLSVDESYLLIPYVYERLHQQLTVSAGYTDAMNYYQRRISSLQQLSDSQIAFSGIEYDATNASIILQNNSLDYGRHFPASFITNYQLLTQYSQRAEAPSLRQNIQQSLHQHDIAFQSVLTTLLGLRLEYLKSYLNQSRYGLARLYDSSRTNEANN